MTCPTHAWVRWIQGLRSRRPTRPLRRNYGTQAPSNTDPTSEDYKKVRAIVDRATKELQSLGATIVDSVSIRNVIDRLDKVYDGNVDQTEPR